MAHDTTDNQPGIDGSCPRCMATLMVRAGGWRGIADMADLEDGDRACTVYSCLMCGHWEDSQIRANRLAQHVSVTPGRDDARGQAVKGLVIA